ncbi:TPA_asm: DNA primase [Porphyromonas phage phage022a_WW2931]|uniref:DNA primase n=1 Tax=Porphyromonas phage phage022a_WW2931 TaxID=3154112 RepID=A0AAT9J8Q7_9CAUD|nr:DNA primase [Porphyromonas gingivalis]PDP66826.1 DNA primase [Porphyromonas gingivalis]
MSTIPQDVIDSVRAASPIETVIAEYVALRRAGANYKCTCPFHADNNASLMVSPGKEIWKCFGCGKGGNVFTFLQEHEGISFPEAVRILATRAGIKIPEAKLSDEELERQRKRESLESALSFARDAYRSLVTDPSAEEFLASRKISAETLALYETGYAPSGRDYLLQQARRAQHADAVMLDAGLIGRSEHGGHLYDRFSGRIVWPFHTPSGRITGFTGRCIDGKSEAKYLNSPDTPLFSKGRVLFGLWQAKRHIVQEQLVYLVEGQIDVMRMADIGVRNAVCGSGTALTPEQARLLLRFTENVTLVYDGDEAGIKATKRNAEVLLQEGLNVRVIDLPRGHDPDTYFLTASEKERTKMLKSSKDVITYLYHKSEADDMDAMTKADAIGDLCRLIALVSDSITAGQLTKTLARLSETSGEDLTDAVRRHRQSRPKRAIPEVPGKAFIGMDELRELAEGKRVAVELTWTPDEYGEKWNSTPALLVSGMPSTYELQDLRTITDRLRTQIEINIGEELEEPAELETLRQMARAGFDLTILQRENKYETVSEDGEEHCHLVSTLREMGWTEYYISLYSGFHEASENTRNVVLQRCAEEISYADDTTRAANMTRYARMLDVTKQALTAIADPFIKLRRNEARQRSNAIEDEEGNAVLINMDEVPSYVMEDEDLRKQYQRFGYFPLRNKQGTRDIGYMFNDKGRGYIRVGNFYMRPLVHIMHEESEKNKRIVELSVSNHAGYLYMDFISKEMLGLSQFEARIWERGGLCFTNGNQERLKAILHSMADKFRPCMELEELGWNDNGFFAFSNGLYREIDGEGQFTPVDEIGLVEHEGEGYFLPTFSRIRVERNADRDRQSKYFKYDPDKTAKISFSEWAELMNEVYKVNDNGKWATIFAIMSAFRSEIFNFDRLFTAIFFVGPTNSGKSKIAYSTRALYMPEEAPYFNLNLGSIPALSELLKRFRDVPAMLDEFKNDLPPEKIETLKAAVYDGEGRQKRKSATSKEIDSAMINAPIILLGQESPDTNDGALGNRCVICDVPLKGEWTESEKEIFERLKSYEAQGLHHILFQVLAIRPKVREYFRPIQQGCLKDLHNAVRGKLSSSESLPRVLNTVSLFLAMLRLIERHTDLQLPFSYDDFFPLAVEKVVKLVESQAKSNKVNRFFQAVATLLNDGKVVPGRDYKIDHPRTGAVTIVKSGRTSESVPVPDGTRLLYLKVASIFPHYARLVGSEHLPIGSLQKYLEGTPYYIGRSASTRFTWEETVEVSSSEAAGYATQQEDPINGGMMPPMVGGNLARRVRKTKFDNTSCVVFDYEQLRETIEIDLARDMFEEEKEEMF